MTIFEYRRDRYFSIYISPTFSHIAGTYQIAHGLGGAIWGNVAAGSCLLELWLMAGPTEVQPISHQQLIILIMLEYLICLRLL